MKMKSRTSIIIILGISLFAAFYVLMFRYVTDIEKPFEQGNLKAQRTVYSDTARIGVVSRFTPQKIYEGYQPIMDYLTEQTGILFELELSATYRETLSALKEGKTLAAFLGSYIFAEENDGELFAVLKPLAENGKSYFRSVLIVKEQSPIFRVDDLRGKRVALPSAEAFSGNWLQKILLKKYGLSVSDLKEIKHFDFHNSVVRQVLMGNYDAGVVKDRVAKEYSGQGIRAVIYSEPVPGSPLVISSKSDKRKVDTLISVLLAAKSPITKTWDKEFEYGFVRASNSDYVALRKLFDGGAK